MKRGAGRAAVLLGVLFVTFWIGARLPSDPARLAAGPKADAATVARIRTELGLDRPLPMQFAAYVSRVVRGDWGRSYVTRQPVTEAIAERLPATLLLATVTLAGSLLFGLGAGVLVALRPPSRLWLALTAAAVSTPGFWVGLLLLYVFGFRLGWLPLGGFGLPHVVLPAIALGLGGAASYARLVEQSLRQVLPADFVRTARAKGLPPSVVIGRHALRNALLPVVTVLALDFAGLLSGVVLTETVFHWPGLGRLAVESVFQQDLPLLLGCVQLAALLVILANLGADWLCGRIDPRFRETIR